MIQPPMTDDGRVNTITVTRGPQVSVNMNEISPPPVAPTKKM